MAIDLGDIPTGTEPTTAEKLQIRSAIGVGTTDALTISSLTVTTTAGANVFSTSAAALQNAGYLGVARAINLIDTAGISWSSTSTLLGATGTNLLQDAAGILAQRNGTAKQALRVYNTALSGAPEWAEFDWITSGIGNTLRIGTNKSGDGAARPIEFVTGGVAKWQISAAGHLMSAGVTDNTYDIGASGANRPRNIYVAGQLYLGGVVRTSGGIRWDVGGTVFIESSNGVVSLQSSSGNDFGRLQLGGTTSAFPAIKRNGTGIDIRLADDSTFTTINASDYTGYNGGVAKTYVGGAGVFQAVSTGYFALCSSAINVFTQDTFLSRSAPGVWQMGTSSTNATADLRLRNVIQSPGVGTTVTPANNADLVFETTSNTSVTLKLKGSDGTVRSVALTLA